MSDLSPASVERLDALPLTPSRARASGEPLGEVAALGPGLSHLRVHVERLAPGRRSSRPHHHTAREECVLVLEGAVTLVLGDSRREVQAGELASLPAGGPAHVIVNEAADAARLLVFSASPVADEVVYAPA